MSENVMVDVNVEMDALRKELERFKDKYEKLERQTDWMRDEMSYNKGMIEGLKFAIRCNGVSGAEVKKAESYYE